MQRRTIIAATAIGFISLIALSATTSATLLIGAYRDAPGLTNTTPCFVVSRDDNEAGFCLNPMQVRFGEKSSVKYNREQAALQEIKEGLQRRLADLRSR